MSKIEKTDAEWRAELDPERYAVLREAATERAWTGELLDESRAGLYTCAACNAELFRSGTKFDSGCGWPSFYDSVNPDAVELIEDTSLGVVRTEVRCAACGSHLGHVFDDGFGTPTGLRYCMNSLSLGFTEVPAQPLVEPAPLVELVETPSAAQASTSSTTETPAASTSSTAETPAE